MLLMSSKPPGTVPPVSTGGGTRGGLMTTGIGGLLMFMVTLCLL